MESKINIREAIVELKNKVELMLDLAYSSLVLQDKDVAREVLKLEEYFDWFHTQFQLISLSMFHEKSSKSEILGLIKLSTYMEIMADTAAKIAETIMKLDISAGKKLFRMIYEESEEFISVAVISKRSMLAGRTIGESEIESKYDIKILAVRRGKAWFFDPPETFKLEPNDVIVIRGYAEALDDIKRIASGS